MWDDAGEVCLWSGTERFTRDWNPDVRGNDRLLYTSQTAWERSRNIIRSAEAHDRYFHLYPYVKQQLFKVTLSRALSAADSESSTGSGGRHASSPVGVADRVGGVPGGIVAAAD